MVVQIGVPYWPHRPWVISTALKVWREAKTYHREHRMYEWGQKWLYHMRYAFNLRSGLAMARNRSFTKPWNSAQPQIIIRNHYDEYCRADIDRVKFNGPRTFVSLPGEHDDCWEHPERYVSLLQSKVKT
jgi:hypothetical protein